MEKQANDAFSDLLVIERELQRCLGAIESIIGKDLVQDFLNRKRQELKNNSSLSSSSPSSISGNNAKVNTVIDNNDKVNIDHSNEKVNDDNSEKETERDGWKGFTKSGVHFRVIGTNRIENQFNNPPDDELESIDAVNNRLSKMKNTKMNLIAEIVNLQKKLNMIGEQQHLVFNEKSEYLSTDEKDFMKQVVEESEFVLKLNSQVKEITKKNEKLKDDIDQEIRREKQLETVLERKGYLVKKGKKRWFVLKLDAIMWFVTDKSEELKGRIVLAGCDVKTVDSNHDVDSSSDHNSEDNIKNNNNDNNNDNKLDMRTTSKCIQLITPSGKIYVLYGKNSQQINEWLRLIRLAIIHATAKQAIDLGSGLESQALNMVKKKTKALNISNDNRGFLVEKHGWLKKKGKDRYYAVINGVLMWFSEQPNLEKIDLAKLHGFVTLYHGSIVEPTRKLTNGIGSEFSFTISTALGTCYTVYAKNTEDLKGWVSFLKDVVFRNSQFDSIYSTQPMSHSGWLTKKLRKGGHWFLLRGDTLSWYEKEQDLGNTRTAVGSINLYGCNVSNGEMIGDLKTVIIFGNHGNVTFLNTDSINTAQIWKEKLELTLNYVNYSQVVRHENSVKQLTEKKGWLNKKGRRRWFELKNDFLMWYRNESGGTVLGSVLLDSCSVYKTSDLNSFNLVTSVGREYLLTCNSFLEATKWTSALNLVLNRTSKEKVKYSLLAKKHYDDLIDILLHRSPMLLMTFCRVCESDEALSSIVKLCYKVNTHVSFINRVVDTEFNLEAESISKSTLFRGNSVATKVVREFLTFIGESYLEELLCPIIKDISTDPVGFEIDPQRCRNDPSVNLESNLLKLRTTCQTIFDRIVHSVDRIPIHLREVFGEMAQVVVKYLPDCMDKAVMTFFFLRYICPSIFSPDNVGLINDPPSNQVRRVLILVSKIIQNLANGNTFKEDYMQGLNPFVKENYPVLCGFLGELRSCPKNSISDNLSSFSLEEKEADLTVLVRYLSDSYEKMDEYFQNFEIKKLKPKELEDITTQYERLGKILSELRPVA